METKIVRYNCNQGHAYDIDGAYSVGDTIDGIGAVQSISYPCDVCGKVDCECED